MSCHFLVVERKNRPLWVMLGWSVLDQAYFLFVGALIGEKLHYACKPDDAKAPPTLSFLLYRLKHDFKFELPEAIGGELIQDCLQNRAHSVTTSWVAHDVVYRRQAQLAPEGLARLKQLGLSLSRLCSAA